MVNLSWSTIEVMYCFIQKNLVAWERGGPGGSGGGRGEGEAQKGWQGDTDWGPGIICNYLFQVQRYCRAGHLQFFSTSCIKKNAG